MASDSLVDRRYALKREIARGAMGIVFEATHVRLETSVALKTLTPTARDSPAGTARLMREARALALCRHPRVVRVHDAGECAQHGPFLSLEMLEGRSLESFLVARQRLDVATVASMGEQLCAAVAHVHAQGVVHRDIKPANLLVTRGEPGGGDSLCLIDFGVASIGENLGSPGDRLTGTGELLGTVEYMAPEQLLGATVGNRLTDVYAIGVVLYEALTGAVPFTGGPMAVATAHAVGSAVPPLATLRSDVPLALADAIHRAMLRETADRMPSAAAFGRVCLEVAGGTSASLDLLERPNHLARRLFPRVPYAAPAHITTRGGSFEGRTEDLSEGGLLIVTEGECVEGDSVTVRFPLPTSGAMVDVAGVARWTKSQRGHRAVGVAFRAIDAEALEEIRAYAAPA